MKTQQTNFEGFEIIDGKDNYLPVISVSENKKGVLDVDTVKGCTIGMKAHPNGGCYDECYAYKIASRYGRDFTKSVSRNIPQYKFTNIFCDVKEHYSNWYRIGTAGDPSHDWDNTVSVCEMLQGTGKIPVIITKHWKILSDLQIQKLKKVCAVINTSTSGMDSDAEIKHRVRQIERLRNAGIKSVCRVVTCQYGLSEWALAAKKKQNYLLSLHPVIDNPLRASLSNKRVLSGEIILTKREEAIGGGKFISLHDASIYLGTCDRCPDQCGVEDL